jgi:molecular chaperone GrpE
VLDSLERGLAEASADPARLRAGVELTLQAVAEGAGGPGPRDPRPVGQPFDPEQHQAMSVVETSQYDPAPSPA